MCDVSKYTYTPNQHSDPYLYAGSPDQESKVKMLQNRIAVLELQVACLMDQAKPRSAKVVQALETISLENERLRMIIYQQRSMIREFGALLEQSAKGF